MCLRQLCLLTWRALLLLWCCCCVCCCCWPHQAKQVELEELQSGLSADASALSQQLVTFEARREGAIQELQVR